MLSRLDGFRPGLFAGTYVVAGALFAGDGLLKILGAWGGLPDAGSATVVAFSGAIEVLAGALVASASRLVRRCV